jgi:hypothetical protein
MKRIFFLAPFVLYCNILFSQNDVDYSSKVDLELVTQKVSKKLNKLTLKYSFPKDYEAVLESSLYEFEYKKELAKYKYSESESIIHRENITAALEEWRKSETYFIEKAEKIWVKTAIKYDLEKNFKNSFTDYHFYLYHSKKNNTSFIQKKIVSLLGSSDIIKVTEKIAEKETDRVISKCSAVNKLEESTIDEARKGLYSYLKNLTIKTLSNKSEIKLTRDSDLYCSYAYEQIIQIEKDAKVLRKIKKDKKFITKAKTIGLDSLTAATILTLIEKRKTDLKSLKDMKKEADDTAQLFESTDLKTKTEIKREFSSKLAQIINRKQFSQLFGDVFMKNVEENVGSKIEGLKKIYNLKEDQLEKIKAIVESYYFNRETIAAYYSFDKKLKKQKLSALSFRFEKEYKELMKGMDLEIKPNVKKNNRTFLWNN